MKNIILLVLATLLIGCATTNAEYVNPTTGAQFTMKTKTLWKDVKDVNGAFTPQGFQFELGSSAAEGKAEAVACLLAPHLCQAINPSQ